MDGLVNIKTVVRVAPDDGIAQEMRAVVLAGQHGAWEVGPRSAAEVKEAATHFERVVALCPAPMGKAKFTEDAACCPCTNVLALMAMDAACFAPTKRSEKCQASSNARKKHRDRRKRVIRGLRYWRT